MLSVDREYRRRAAALPALHITRGERRYLARFSDTARAHALHRARDWVVLSVWDGGPQQYTVVTARLGPLKGKRVVRGREAECWRSYGGTHENRKSAVPTGGH